MTNEGEAIRKRYGAYEANAYGRGEWTEHGMTRFPAEGIRGTEGTDRQRERERVVKRMTGLRGYHDSMQTVSREHRGRERAR